MNSWYFPKKNWLSVIHQILKINNKSIHDSSNYRPISIMPITAKIFESSIAKIIYDKMVFHENQFRFTMKEVG